MLIEGLNLSQSELLIGLRLDHHQAHNQAHNSHSFSSSSPALSAPSPSSSTSSPSNPRALVRFDSSASLTSSKKDLLSSSSSSSSSSTSSSSSSSEDLLWLKLDSVATKDLSQFVSMLRTLKKITLIQSLADNLVDELKQFTSLTLFDDDKKFCPPPELFENWEIRCLDLTCTKLTEVPEYLTEAKDLMVLKLGGNEISDLQKTTFERLPLLQWLDLSENQLKSLPSWLPLLGNLGHLDLSQNPLGDADLTPIFQLPQLTRIILNQTRCFLSNIKPSDKNAKKLECIELSGNDLTKVPELLMAFKNLKVLNLASNKLTDDHFPEELGTHFAGLESLDLSSNLFYTLPPAICLMQKLKRIMLQSNFITTEGLPKKISKLKQLERFNLSNNKLDTLPVFVCRLHQLSYLNLKNNNIESLPVEIYLLKDNIRLELAGNPNLCMPPRPKRHISKDAAWGDFSPKKAEKAASSPATEEPAPPSKRKEKKTKETAAHDYKNQIVEDKEDSKKGALMLKAMQAQAGVSDDTKIYAESDIPAPPPPPSARSFLQKIQRPDLDYSDIFDKEVGQKPGMKAYVIDNLKPTPVGEDEVGKFCVADAYIILLTKADLELQRLVWDIFLWIGEDCTIDKQSCGAIMAVNLRNHLGSNQLVIRESQGEESPAFRKLFQNIALLDKTSARASGLKDITIRKDRVHLYRVIYQGNVNRLEEVAPNFTGLKTNEVFLLLTWTEIFLWIGSKATLQAKAKGRFVADSLHGTDYKSRGDVNIVEQGSPDKADIKFWNYIGGEGVVEDPAKGTPVDPPRPQYLFSVVAGKGFVDMPLVKGRLSSRKLKSSGCYILDSFTHVSLWIGKDSPQNYRMLCWALAQELLKALERPSWSYVEKITEGTETERFKLNFKDWITTIKVDHASYLQSTEPKAKVSKIAVDVQSIYSKPPIEISEKQSKKFIRDANESLKSIQGYVLSGGQFKKLPAEEIGLFYNSSVYVFMCSYYIFDEEESSEEESDEEDSAENEIDYTIYFWEGKHASQMGWLKFKFGFQGTLENEIKRLFKKTPKIVRTEQQKEPAKLLAHFNQKIVIKNGERPRANEKESSKVSLYRIHCGLSHVHFRAIQVPLSSKSLVSSDVYAVTDPESSTLFLWQGKGSRYSDIKYASALLPLVNHGHTQKFKVEMLNEGQEPVGFWKLLGGKHAYPSCLNADGSPIRPRFWKCSNSTGYFKVTEIIEFCQDDLVEDDVIFMDCGPTNKIYLWTGSRCSTLGMSFAKRTVQAYLAHQPDPEDSEKSRTFEDDVIVIKKGREPDDFKALFIGWDLKVYKTMEVGNTFTRDHSIPWGKVVESYF